MKTFEKIFEVVKKIPMGKVATYGDVADMAGTANPRIVGYALSSLNSDSDIPWHRIVNYHGEISSRAGNGSWLQKEMLESEGITFNKKSRINLKIYRW
jgi:methylated-DNA-protein-cysteine methyltransferase-like protein